MADSLLSRLQFAAHRGVARLGYGVAHYRHSLRQAAWLAATSNCIPTATTPLECAEIFHAVRATEKIPGVMAEAGVYRGGTASVILRASAKPLHLFDTFAGLPSSDSQFQKGEYFGTVGDVRRNLAQWESRVVLHQGLFLESTAGLDDLRFSFVHIDLDLYESTAAALNWFWPRLHRGGMLLSHDYPFSNGVVRAFDEFFAEQPIGFLPLTGNQCLAIKS